VGLVVIRVNLDRLFVGGLGGNVVTFVVVDDAHVEPRRRKGGFEGHCFFVCDQRLVRLLHPVEDGSAIVFRCRVPSLKR
jgi:hypothetical protein